MAAINVAAICNNSSGASSKFALIVNEENRTISGDGNDKGYGSRSQGGEQMVNIRLATLHDVDELVQMRWDFSKEDYGNSSASFEEFHQICSEFLVKAIEGGDWYIWVAEVERSIVSHMYLQLIHKVPRPGKSPDPYFGYVTNVYTRPEFRSQSFGSKIHIAMEEWSKENKVEFLILWPSSNSVQFYSRNGFSRCEEAMEKHW